MRKKEVLLLFAILACSSYGVDQYTGAPHYRIFEDHEILEPYERGAYENLLRVVDEQNRQKGNPSHYLEKAQYKSRTEFDTVDLIPVAQFAGETDEYKDLLSSRKYSSIAGYSSVHDILKYKDKGLEEKHLFDKLSYSREGNIKRFYFGKGNQAKDIIMTESSSFEEKVKTAKESKKDLYILEGTYERPEARKKNQISFSVEDYESLKSKTSEERLEILAKKMKETLQKDIKVKNGDLYTTDETGKDWKVLWAIEPVSDPQISYGTTEKYFKDDIFTNIFVYIPTKEKGDTTDSRGRVLYTKEKDIILEDKYSYGDVATIKDELIKNYKKDKQQLSDSEFKKKWITPFEKDGEFTKAMKKMEEDIEIFKNSNKEEMDKKKREADEKLNSWKYSLEAPREFVWKYVWESDPEKRKVYIDGLTEEKDKKFVQKYLEQEQISIDNDYFAILNETIPKKYGVYTGWKATKEEKKWLDRVVANKDIERKYLGKNVEFRGQGRIDGTVDLGEGNNQLTIAEQFTGKYGTNIILGPKAKLKNIAYVNISGAIGGNTKASLSGRTSLTLDIDPSIKNKEGNLIQHAFKDSDKNIVFRSIYSSLNSENINDFSVELMTSRIAEDTTVDMGRSLNYTTQDFKDSSKKISAKINIIPDSITHTVSEKKKKSEVGNTLLSVKVKEKLREFNEEENTVYRSIRNSGHLDMLQPTLTSTNKKTIFQVSDDVREEKKKIELIRWIRTKTPEEVLAMSSQFYLDNVKEKEAKEKIIKIANSDKMREAMSKIHEFKGLQNRKEYQELHLKEKGQEIVALNPEEVWQALSQNSYSEEMIQQKLKEMKTILDSIDVKTISDLSSSYSKMEEMANIARNVKYLKEELEKKPTDSRKRQSLFSTLNTLKINLEKQSSLSEDVLDYEVAKYLDSYETDAQREYLELKDMIFYSVREEEALSELKNMVEQLKDRNIYAKLNKIAKNEISTYTNFPFDIDHSLLEDRAYARGGFISSRTVQKNFKGNIYTGYGLYEEEYQPGLRFGVMVGGANTNHTEVYRRSLRTVATESSIQGVSAYVGAYANKSFSRNFEWITGIGLQYGFYTVKRQMKNNYQELKSKGNAQIGGLQTYTGFVYSYPLPNDLILRGKGILSYSILQQGKVKEKEGLNLEIASQDYQYVDGELGISLAKTLYDDSKRSTLSGGISGIFGLSGYENKALQSKIRGSNSSFSIVGDRTKKDSVKVHLDYNMQIDTGFNYGLEGTYITNNEQNDVKIGLKAGWKF